MHWTLDGEKVDLEEFLAVNEFDAEEVAEIRAMLPGDEKVFGGGAAATFVLRRVREPRKKKVHSIGFTGGVCGAKATVDECAADPSEITCKKCLAIRRKAIERFKQRREAAQPR